MPPKGLESFKPKNPCSLACLFLAGRGGQVCHFDLLDMISLPRRTSRLHRMHDSGSILRHPQLICPD